ASRSSTRTRFAHSRRSVWPSSRGSRNRRSRSAASTESRIFCAGRPPRACGRSIPMKIAILPGDGIGPEIAAEGLRLLEVLRREGLAIETETAPIGGAGYDAAGDPLPEATLALARRADAVLLGAVGGPRYDTLPRPMRPEQGILGIRKALGLFANLRPALL